MYTTCLFCQADLGRNDALEAFPVGRRLAYDQARGRLWVVCRRCERWNLTPLEERWEAMEAAERLYRGTRLRAATDHVGLARLTDGTELVRIGRPLRPEFAAWRYGDQFGRRRNRRLLWIGAGVTVATVVVVAGPVMGLFSVGGFGNFLNIFNVANGSRRTKPTIVVADGPEKSGLRTSLHSAERARLVGVGDEFGLVLSARAPRSGYGWRKQPGDEVRFTGDEALRVAGRLLPHLNRAGGSAVDVRSAVELLDTAGTPGALFARTARDARRFRSQWRGTTLPDGSLHTLSAPVRLALEMAAHEEQERRALEGELHELETAWKEAEEIAAIADDLLLPESVGEKLDQLRARSRARTGAASNPSTDSGAASNS